MEFPREVPASYLPAIPTVAFTTGMDGISRRSLKEANLCAKGFRALIKRHYRYVYHHLTFVDSAVYGGIHNAKINAQRNGASF